MRFRITLFLAVLLTACQQRDQFTINGEVANAGALKKVYLLAADSSSIQLVDSTNLSENGQFQFRALSAYPNLYKLRIGGMLFDVIAQNGDAIAFKTDLKDTAHASAVSGSQATLALQEWDRLNDQYAAQSQALLERYQAELQRLPKREDSLLKVYQAPYQQIAHELAAKTWEFAMAHQNSLAGFYAATSLDHKQYEPQLIRYADEIKDRFPGNPAVSSFLREMNAVKPVSIGQPAPEFVSATVEGKPIKLSDYRGKYLIVDFWASWCPPCRAENPNVVKLYHQYHPLGLQLLGVSLDTETKDWQKAINADHLDWTQVSDQARFYGPAEKLYHIQEIPANFIIDPQGRIAGKNLFGSELAAFLDTTMKHQTH